jgi:hypothetical protein
MKRFVSLLLPALFFTTGAFSQEKKSALDAIVEAERAFARTSVEKGIRDSFIEFFAEDGINFQPHPTKTREAYAKQPVNDLSYTLNWHPVSADVSQAGDLGYTTGPYTLTAKSKAIIFHSGKSRRMAVGKWFSIVALKRTKPLRKRSSKQRDR